jgi:gas vesicle protein
MGQDPSTIRQEIEQTRGEMGDTVEALGYKADVKTRAKDAISDKVGAAKEKVSGAAGRMSETTPDGGDVQHGAHRAKGIAEENPLGLAIGGLAVGFLAGLALPGTRVEDERIGPVADQVKEKAKETGEEALERGKQVAQQTAESAKETAREAGQQQAEEMRSSAEEKAGEAQDQARSQARVES